jgi:hypothetical protein
MHERARPSSTTVWLLTRTGPETVAFSIRTRPSLTGPTTRLDQPRATS